MVNDIEQQKLQFMEHIMRHRSIENDLLTGMVFGKRSRGRQKTRMTNTIKEKLGLTMTGAIRTAQNREKWKNIVYAPPQPFGKQNVLNDSCSSNHQKSWYKQKAP